jgi:hypothetical protein
MIFKEIIVVYHPSIIRRTAFEDVALAAGSALDLASRQQTGNIGSVTVPNADGTSTIAGVMAGEQGVVHWVGDTTPPGRPTGVTVGSGAGMILVSWDGGLEGGVPPDFDHLSLIVDGLEAGRALAKGTCPLGPYEPGSVHEVKVVAWDDAHAQDGSPAPNGSSAWGPERVTVSGADIDPESLGILVTKAATDPEGAGKHRGDLWLRYGEGERAAISAEWWWDGAQWVPIPVAVYLDQLAARDVRMDAATVGALSAGIVRSGQFTTPDGLTGFDAQGFWAKAADGTVRFRANSDGVQAVGGFATAKDGNRVELGQFFDGTDVLGGVQGKDGARTTWVIWGERKRDGSTVLHMGSSPQQPQFMASDGADGQIASMSGTRVLLSASRGIDWDAPHVSVRGVGLPLTGMAFDPKGRGGFREFTFRQVSQGLGSPAFRLDAFGDTSGLRVPVSGYYELSGYVNLGYGRGDLSCSLSKYNPAKGAVWTDIGWPVILQTSLQSHNWIFTSLSPQVLWLDEGDVVTLRCADTYDVGAGTQVRAALMPY